MVFSLHLQVRAHRDKRSLLEIQNEEIARKQRQQENLLAMQLAQLSLLSSSGVAGGMCTDVLWVRGFESLSFPFLCFFFFFF